jgi:hypothetical protein
MVDSEREMLREEEEAKLYERRPFESSRQATYEDSLGSGRDRERGWEHDDRD